MERLYPNREVLLALYRSEPMLAIHLSALNTSTEIGQRIAASMPWLFSETELQVVIFERLVNAPEHSGEYVGNYVDDLMSSLGVPWLNFISAGQDVPFYQNDRVWPEDVPSDIAPGATFEYEGVKMIAIHNCSGSYLSAVPAHMILFRERSQTAVVIRESIIPASAGVLADFEIGPSGKLIVTERAISRHRSLCGN